MTRNQKFWKKSGKIFQETLWVTTRFLEKFSRIWQYGLTDIQSQNLGHHWNDSRDNCIFASWFRMPFCSFLCLFSDSAVWKELNPVISFGLLSSTFFSNNFSFLNFLFNDFFQRDQKLNVFTFFDFPNWVVLAFAATNKWQIRSIAWSVDLRASRGRMWGKRYDSCLCSWCRITVRIDLVLVKFRSRGEVLITTFTIHRCHSLQLVRNLF